jgi:hypothetical protein
MPRPQRKEINFSKESILGLMQEIYNELVEQRNTAIRIQNKMLSMLKDAEDMTTIGPVIEKHQVFGKNLMQIQNLLHFPIWMMI